MKFVAVLLLTVVCALSSCRQLSRNPVSLQPLQESYESYEWSNNNGDPCTCTRILAEEPIQRLREISARPAPAGVAEMRTRNVPGVEDECGSVAEGSSRAGYPRAAYYEYEGRDANDYPAGRPATKPFPASFSTRQYAGQGALGVVPQASSRLADADFQNMADI